MNRTYAFQNAPCCSATSKRTRERCKAPAVRAGRFAASTERAAADQGGKRNGTFKHGLYTNEAVQECRLLRELLR
jgi:hypothetical protein